MDYSEDLQRTYTLSFSCPCVGCLKKLENIDGVVRVLEVNKDEEKVTISATGDIQTIIRDLKKKHKKVVKLLLGEESRCPMDKPVDLQIVPPKQQIQKVALHQPEFTGVIVRAPKFIVENKYELYSMHEHNGSCSGHAHNGSYARHEHNLQLKTYNKRFSCDICCEDGYGPRYKWNGHNPYEIHEECKNPKITVTHELFSGSIFELSNRLEHADPCIACGKSVCGRFC